MRYIVLGSLSMSIAGLFLIYVTAANVEPENIEIGEIGGDLIGSTVSTEGQIKSVREHENGHLFLEISDGETDLQVPVFSNVARHMDKRIFKKGFSVKVTGVVDEYRRQLQIIPRKPEDVVLTGAG